MKGIREFKKVENIWARALKNNQKVTLDMKINYELQNTRPTSFDIIYTIDGEEFRHIIMSN